MNPLAESASTWITRLPSQLACFLIAICLVSSQLNPCDSVVNIDQGDSVQFILLAMGVGFLVAVDGMLGARNRGVLALPFSVFAVTCGLFSGWLLFCTTQQYGQGNVRHAMNGCWQWIAEWVLLLSTVRLARCPKTMTHMVALMIACAAGTVGYGLFQYFVTMPMDRQTFAANPDQVLRSMGITPGSTDAILYSTRLASTEPIGPFALTNSMAGFLGCWLVFMVVFAVVRLVCREANLSLDKWSRRSTSIVSAAMCLGMFLTLLLTKSRTAWIAAMLGCLVAPLVHPTLRQIGWQWVKRNIILAGAFAIIVLIGLGVMMVRDPKLIREAGKSLSYRFDYWQGAVSLMERKPLVGYGANNFQANYNHVKKMTASESPADPHNFFLETGVAGGVPLAALLCVLLGWVIWQWMAASASVTSTTGQASSVEAPIPWGAYAFASGTAMYLVGTVVFHFFTSSDPLLYSIVVFVLLAASTYAGIVRLRWFPLEGLGTTCFLCASVILVHLLASGGWMLPGVMNSFCLLVGVGIARIPFGGLTTSIVDRWQSPLRVLAVGLMVVMGVACVRTTCIPVIQGADKLAMIHGNLIVSQDAETWLTLMEVDRHDPELARQAANHCLQILASKHRSMGQKEFANWQQAFDQANQEYVRRDPVNWMSWTESGKWNAALAELKRDATGASIVDLNRKAAAIQSFEKAAELYPHSISVQLQRAVAAAWNDRHEEVKRLVEKVYEIDATTPHLDRKLAPSLVFVPVELEKKYRGLDSGAKVDGSPGMVRGEPVASWLRTTFP